MNELSWPDRHHLRAAEGWLGLGDHREAFAEIEKIPPDRRAHPDVLNLRWQVFSRIGHWQACVDVARAITEMAPDSPAGWIQLSFALHELKRTTEARDNLLPVVGRFPDEPTMRYNLACYETQLGNLDRGREWLRKAFSLPDSDNLKASARTDPDLKPLWEELEAL
jgi:predicted Zn-dependent protease